MARTKLVSSAQQRVVGIIGLGRMGTAIARRLRSVEVTVLGCDRRSDAREVAASAGLRWIQDVSELAAASEVVITSLPGSDEVRSVIEPILDALGAGAVWIDMTSGLPVLADEIRAHAPDDVRILECPVGGGPDDAAEGRLLGYLGAEEDDRAACEWLLTSLCRDFAHTGRPGSGYAVKLLANLLWFGQAVAVSEALAIALRAGLDPEQIRAALARGAAASRFLDRDAPRLLRGDDMPSFALSRCVEELEGVLQMGRARDLELPVAERVTDIYRRALDRYGDVDGELLGARFVADLLGVEFAACP